jgi:hypothetical protein
MHENTVRGAQRGDEPLRRGAEGRVGPDEAARARLLPSLHVSSVVRMAHVLLSEEAERTATAYINELVDRECVEGGGAPLASTRAEAQHLITRTGAASQHRISTHA